MAITCHIQSERGGGIRREREDRGRRSREWAWMDTVPCWGVMIRNPGWDSTHAARRRERKGRGRWKKSLTSVGRLAVRVRGRWRRWLLWTGPREKAGEGRWDEEMGQFWPGTVCFWAGKKKKERVECKGGLGLGIRRKSAQAMLWSFYHLNSFR
uniref:Uncharacterized protein n=1 Tax=Setaria viridis TaxID=4556 RepID=A0A4V6D2Z0_SETVI|nr:hypothetical protein SEVIR_8G116500v2 [Setaria viridis]